MFFIIIYIRINMLVLFSRLLIQSFTIIIPIFTVLFIFSGLEIRPHNRSTRRVRIRNIRSSMYGFCLKSVYFTCFVLLHKLKFQNFVLLCCMP